MPVLPAAAGFLLLLGSGLMVGGVYVLAGPGWALIAAAQVCMLAGGVLVRGLLNA